MLGSLQNIFFYFIFYSVIGWIYETALCSVEAGRAVNRGFLNGPYLPIYGAGAVAFLLLLGAQTNPLVIFVFGALIACTLEYLTSFFMELVFHARWWDYSTRKYNLNGRICLAAAAAFGTFAVILIKFLHPFFFSVFSALPVGLFTAVNGTMTVVFVLDLVITLKGMRGFSAPDAKRNFQQKRLLEAFPSLKFKD